MKAALQEKDPDQARATLRGAAQALAAIRDRDAQALFSRDGRKQVEATELAKRMTIGERERYTITNAGPAALAAAVNISGAVASLGLNIEKAVAQSHGVTVPAQYGDQNDARTLAQGSAPVTAPYVAAERARFQKTRMAKTIQTLAREGDRVTLKLDLPAGRATALDAGDTDTDQALDNLIKQLEGLPDLAVPERAGVDEGQVPDAQDGDGGRQPGHLGGDADRSERRAGAAVDDAGRGQPRQRHERQRARSFDPPGRTAGRCTAAIRATTTQRSACAESGAPSLPAQIAAPCASTASATPARAKPGTRRVRPVRDPTRAERHSDAGRRGGGG